MTEFEHPTLYGLGSRELAELVDGTGRARAIWTTLAEGHDPFSEGVLGERLRKRLSAVCRPGLPHRIVQRASSACGTLKLLLALDRGGVIEMVLIPTSGRTTLCVSSQIGCAHTCIFCITATQRLQRSLTVEEIMGQLKTGIDEALALGYAPVRNVVFMGMGEPLDNLAVCRVAIERMCDPHLLGLAPGNLTLSTVGTSPQAIREAGSLPVRLAWSLHAAEDDLRKRLVPSSRHAVTELRDAFAEQLVARNRRLFVEITLLQGLNDRDANAVAVADLFEPIRARVRVNLLAMNPGRAGQSPASEERIDSYRQVLRQRGYFCSRRRSRGSEQRAACGQLATIAVS